MENDISLRSEQIKQEIFKLLDESQLPPVIVYYITKEVADLTQRSYKAYLNNVINTITRNNTTENTSEENIENAEEKQA